jgi:hypothetical protein
MTAQVLIREERRDSQLTEPSGEFRILSVDSRIDRIYLSNAGVDPKASKSKPFEFDVDLSESGRTRDSLSVRYSYTFGRPMGGQVCKISGKAVVRFSSFTPGKDFHTLGSEITNEIAVQIFRKNYEAAYLLHEALRMEAPSPWITQSVSMFTLDQMVDKLGDNA